MQPYFDLTRKTTSKMEDDLYKKMRNIRRRQFCFIYNDDLKKNGRRPPQKMEDDLKKNIKKMEDDLKKK